VLPAIATVAACQVLRAAIEASANSPAKYASFTIEVFGHSAPQHDRLVVVPITVNSQCGRGRDLESTRASARAVDGLKGLKVVPFELEQRSAGSGATGDEEDRKEHRDEHPSTTKKHHA
jgi:hypothetical protein